MTLIVDEHQLELLKEFVQLVSDELIDMAKIGKYGNQRIDGINYKINNLKSAVDKIAVEKKEKIVKPPVVEKVEEKTAPIIVDKTKDKKKK